MQTEVEVLTDHNELICSTSIERIVTGRDAALKQIEALIRQLFRDWWRRSESLGDAAGPFFRLLAGATFR